MHHRERDGACVLMKWEWNGLQCDCCCGVAIVAVELRVLWSCDCGCGVAGAAVELLWFAFCEMSSRRCSLAVLLLLLCAFRFPLQAFPQRECGTEWSSAVAMAMIVLVTITLV